MEKIADNLGTSKGAWTAGVPLPGGDFPVDGFANVVTALESSFPFLDDFWAKRLVRAYGTEAATLLGNATSPQDLGRNFGATLTEAEVKWLMSKEYARTAEDVVWRRNKLGLRLSNEQIAVLDDWMRAQR